ncbi:unnamed protein product [Mytilus edulis]|uniref:Mutator-like transposase domain-containing protein n=1 Tax=Mytilus edulis TaxID=6550 RepID=A0A8S3QY22_MYTED|nr:unnamed protein product [Mytilus edulis]
MGKLRNNGFRTSKQVRKLVSIREGQRKRYFEEDQDLALKSLHADHSYDVTKVLDNDGNNLTPTDDWRIGRRVVELGVIADHLQQCKHCGLPLSLHNIIDIKTYGLGSVLKVLCTNKSCGNINAIPTGKQHDHKIWDVNTKSDGNDNVTVSVDAAWQRRGSGRSYDSLTGKVINYKWRSKACRICQRAETSGNIPRVHKCNKNFTGSAKAMEPDMVVDMVKESRSKGANITAIIGDEDTTTIARLRAKVDPTIVKLSDSNHMKKPIRNRLYELKNKHSTLSPKVISYIMKCFNYLIAQGKGQPKKIEENLHALSKHPFGDHSSCSTDWCRFIADPSIKYKSLPYGKPLQDKALQESLTTLFQKYILNSEKLANLGSTQSNESFNKSVAAKAPKNRFYGGSRSLAYRVAAAVAQKNTGHRYTVDVNVSSGLSPGLYTRKLATLRDIQARKRKAVAITTEAKLRRIALKASRQTSSPFSKSKSAFGGTPLGSSSSLESTGSANAFGSSGTSSLSAAGTSSAFGSSGTSPLGTTSIFGETGSSSTFGSIGLISTFGTKGTSPLGATAACSNFGTQTFGALNIQTQSGSPATFRTTTFGAGTLGSSSQVPGLEIKLLLHFLCDFPTAGPTPSAFPSCGASQNAFPSTSASNISDSQKYTPLDQLTTEEIEAFQAPTFTLGKNPTRPPPKELVF